MGSSYGRQVLETVGYSIQVSADSRPEFKAGGVTIDWSTVTAVNADTALEDGVVVPNGEKYLRYGQVITRLTSQPAQTVQVTGGPTGGTFTITGTRPDTGVGTTQTVAYNAAVSAVQTAMDAIFGAGNTVVSGAGALPANTHTVTFQGALINYAVALMTANGAGLTGGTTPGVTITATVGGGTYNFWGPYDPAATDGRQTISRGDTFILNETMREADLHSNHPQALQGGLLWKDRILMTTGSASLAAGPTVTAVEAAFPRVRYAKN